MGGGTHDVDIIMHGSPCTSVSLAGKQLGANENSGTPSSLMYESIRIIGEVMPKVVIWENVKNLLSPKHKHNYDEYLKRLEKLGYTNYYKVLNAKHYGIPQNRERIFTISILGEHKPFEFPAEIELTTKLVDLLEPDVPEDFYISQEKIDKLLSKEIYQKHPAVLKDGTVSAICSRDYKDPKCIVVGADTLAIKEATKKGYALAGGGYDSVNLEQPNSETRRGRVGHGVAQTLTTSCNQAVVEPVNVYPDGTSRTIKAQYAKTSAANFVREGTFGATGVMEITPINTCTDDTAKTIMAHYSKDSISHLVGDSEYPITGVQCGLRVRKLTPKECWRLMGFTDEVYEKAEKVNSKTQLYKQAGNSIVVNVLMEIIKQLMKSVEF